MDDDTLTRRIAAIRQHMASLEHFYGSRLAARALSDKYNQLSQELFHLEQLQIEDAHRPARRVRAFLMRH